MKREKINCIPLILFLARILNKFYLSWLLVVMVHLEVGPHFLLSFLNTGARIASSSESFLLMGANVEENSTMCRNFILNVLSDLKYLESQTFPIQVNDKCIKVEFTLNELPNDMKMLAFLAGELSNASYYFSTFGNVNQTDVNDYFCTFGSEENDDWKSFCYEKRVADVSKVVLKKKELSKSKAALSTKRSNLTLYISKTLHSRQEELPLLEKYIDCAKAEPLHLKNNVVKELFVKLLKLYTSQSQLGNAKAFSQIDNTSERKSVTFFFHQQCKTVQKY